MAPTARFFGFVAAAALALPAAAQYSVVAPLDPVAGERVLLAKGVCQGGSPTIVRDARVELAPGAMHLKASITFGGFAVRSCERIRILSEPLSTPGSYEALFSYLDTTASTPRAVGPEKLAQLTVRPRPADTSPRYRRLSGNWFDPAAPGRGVNMVQGVSGALLAVVATHPPEDWFDRNGLVDGTNATTLGGWYVMPEGLWISPTEFRGPLFQTRGTAVESSWNASKLEISPVGIAKLTFVSDEEMRFDVTLTYGAGGLITQTQTLRRFRF